MSFNGGCMSSRALLRLEEETEYDDVDEAPQINEVDLETTNPEEEAAYIPYNWVQTQDAILKLEEMTQSRVIVYWVHPRASITDDDAEILYKHLHLMGRQEKITLVITAPGGMGVASLKIARLLRSYCGKLEVMVPHRAASAATILALAGERIVMTPLGALSPIDTSLQHPLNPACGNQPVSVELQEIQHFLRLVRRESNQDGEVKVYPVNSVELLSKHVHPVVLGAMERSSSFSRRLASDVLRLHEKDEAKIARIVDALTDDYPSHAYPISVDEAKRLGISAERADVELEQVLWEIENGVKQVMFRMVSPTSELSREVTTNLVNIETLGCRSFLEARDEEQIVDDGTWVLKQSSLTWYTAQPNLEVEGAFRLESVLL